MDGAAKQTRYANGLRVATRCETVEQFIEKFHRFCEDGAIFVPHGKRQVGTDTAFSFDLVSGQAALVGLGTVLDHFTTPNNRFRRPGIVIGIARLQSSSKRIFEDLLVARAVAERADAAAAAAESTATAPSPSPSPSRAPAAATAPAAPKERRSPAIMRQLEKTPVPVAMARAMTGAIEIVDSVALKAATLGGPQAPRGRTMPMPIVTMPPTRATNSLHVVTAAPLPGLPPASSAPAEQSPMPPPSGLASASGSMQPVDPSPPIAAASGFANASSAIAPSRVEQESIPDPTDDETAASSVVDALAATLASARAIESPIQDADDDVVPSAYAVTARSPAASPAISSTASPAISSTASAMSPPASQAAARGSASTGVGGTLAAFARRRWLAAAVAGVVVVVAVVAVFVLRPAGDDVSTARNAAPSSPQPGVASAQPATAPDKDTPPAPPATAATDEPAGSGSANAGDAPPTPATPPVATAPEAPPRAAPARPKIGKKKAVAKRVAKKPAAKRPAKRPPPKKPAAKKPACTGLSCV